MKTLQQYMNEALVVEGFQNMKVYNKSWDETPVICKEYPTEDPDSGEKFNIRDTDWLYDDTGKNIGNLAEIRWCDDTLNAFILKGVQDEHALKTEVLKSVERWIKKNQADLDDDNYNYIEIYIELKCGLTVDMVWEYEDNGGKPTPEKVWDAWIYQYNHSEVDGDSSYCYCLVDLSKKKVIAGGSDVVFDY